MAKAQPPGPHGLSEPLVPGLRLAGARYMLKRLLGRGRATVVWLAYDAKREQEVALKVLPDSLLQDANALERLKEETRRNGQLAHPQIARTYDFVQDYRLAAIALEYVDGWSLAALRVDRPQRRYTLKEATPWVRQLCAALTYAHTEPRILHLALKPANLLLDSREQLKLTDFGIARSLQGFAGPSDLQAAAAVLGFLSPQQALGEKPSVLDDVYGLGATIYDLLTGTPPFYKGQVLAQVCDRTPPSMTERLSELGLSDAIPEVVEDAVAQCLAKDPAKRPQSISQVLQLLERSEMPAPVSAPQPQKPPAPAAPAAPPPAAPPPMPAPPPKPSEVVVPPAPADAPQPARPPMFLWLGLATAVLAVVCVGALLWALHGSKSRATTSASAGALDTDFDPATNADHEIRVVLEQPDHKILIGGMFTQFGDSPRRGIARLDPDGSIDTTFSASTHGDVFAVALQPDGSIVLGGLFDQLDGQSCRHLGRLNADGSLDEMFTSNAVLNGAVRAAVVQPDGKVLIAGNFTTVKGRRQTRVARLHAHGTRDTTFNVGRGPSSLVWALALQPDGKILLGGDFTAFNQQACGRVVRLEPEGRADAGFDPGSGADATVFAVAVQPDGKVLVAGDFTRMNEVERNRIARLNADGSLDASFNPGAGPNSGVRCLALEPDGKILIGGIFTSVGGVPRGRLARLNADGSLDASFSPGEGASEVVRWLAPQADGKVLVVGGFSQFDGMPCVRLARVQGGKSKTL
jgi:uncharacterized delta-60 repeat protein